MSYISGKQEHGEVTVRDTSTPLCCFPFFPLFSSSKVSASLGSSSAPTSNRSVLPAPQGEEKGFLCRFFPVVVVVSVREGVGGCSLCSLALEEGSFYLYLYIIIKSGLGRWLVKVELRFHGFSWTIGSHLLTCPC